MKGVVACHAAPCHEVTGTSRVKIKTAHGVAYCPTGCHDGEVHPDDLAQLREEFPGWRFGSVWATAASGPDRRRLWARNGDVLLSDWSAAGLRTKVKVEETRTADRA